MSTPSKIQPINDGFDDLLLVYGKNGHAPIAAIQSTLARFIRYRQHQGRPLGHYWGGWDTGAATTGATVLRIGRLDMLDGGCANFYGLMDTIPVETSISTTPGITIDGTYTPQLGSGATRAYYPEPLEAIIATTPTRAPATATGATSEKIVGFDSVYPMAGCFFEDSVETVNDANTTLLTGGFAPGADIIASQSGNYGTVDRMIERFNHVWLNRRPVITWSTQQDSYLEMSVAPHAYRCIFDQRWGTGGNAPSVSGPAISLPVANAGPGLEQTVRVYVWVYAAMSGSTDGGTLAVANRDTSGVMGSMTALHNPQTIGGTGYAWYPSLGSFNPATAPYFNAPTNIPFDRVCFGARSEGATDKVRIKAWMMAVYPSRA